MAHAQAKMIAIAALIGLTGCQHVTQQTNVTPPPVPGIQPDASADVARAQRALAAGRLGAARDGFSEALRSSPNDVIAGLGLAETYMALNDVTTAKHVFEATGRYARGRYSGRVDQGLGLIALQQEKLGEARRRLRAAVDADGALWRAWIGLGRLNTRAGERAAARVAFAQAEANAPVLGRVMNDIGMSYLMERQPKQAIQYLERALLADPRLHMARGNLRIARAMAG
ncbi:MAG: tetratricopeptide repeat protein, partial [Paracoccaceae bacterium]